MRHCLLCDHPVLRQNYLSWFFPRKMVISFVRSQIRHQIPILPKFWFRIFHSIFQWKTTLFTYLDELAHFSTFIPNFGYNQTRWCKRFLKLNRRWLWWEGNRTRTVRSVDTATTIIRVARDAGSSTPSGGTPGINLRILLGVVWWNYASQHVHPFLSFLHVMC